MAESRSAIRAWMRQELQTTHYLQDYVDCGEVQMTALAEAACDVFDDWNDEYDIPEEYFEVAFEVAQWWEGEYREDEEGEEWN